MRLSLLRIYGILLLNSLLAGRALGLTGDDNLADSEDNLQTGMGSVTMATGGGNMDMSMPTMSPHDGDSMMMGMKMFFHGGTDEVILFSKWTVSSWQGMLWSCVCLALMAVLFEAIRIGRQVLLASARSSPPSSSSSGSSPLLKDSYPMAGFGEYGAIQQQRGTTEHGVTTNTSDSTVVDMGEHNDGATACCTQGHPMCQGWHWLQTALHVAQLFVGYCLMLAVMTFNAYIFVAVLLGAGVGHLLIGWAVNRYSDESAGHCF